MDLVSETPIVSFAILRWVAIASTVVLFVLLAAVLFGRMMQMAQTGWREEAARDEEYRRYWVSEGDYEPFVPKRILRQLLLEHLKTGFGAVHIALLALSAATAIVLTALR